MNPLLNYTTAFMVGLLGSVHCVGMCGGIMGALTCSVPTEYRVRHRLIPLLVTFSLGRIISYSAAGAAVGLLSWLMVDQLQPISWLLRHLAGIILILLGLYIAGWWPVLRHLESAGGKIWSMMQPLVRLLLPVKSLHQAFSIGLLWGWLPCGLVYSNLLFAASAGHWQQASIMMFFFGVGTLPALLLTGLFLDRFRTLMQNTNVRNSAGLVILVFGLWTVAGIYLQPHDQHQHKSSEKAAHQSMQTMHSPRLGMPETEYSIKKIIASLTSRLVLLQSR